VSPSKAVPEGTGSADRPEGAPAETCEVICTSCPRGCPLQVRLLQDVVEVSGNVCRRGQAYGETEVRDPRRVLTTTVRVVGGTAPVVPVRTQSAIPRARLSQALEELRTMQVQAPVAIHQVLSESIAGTGVPVLATRAVPEVGSSTAVRA
jgi:CxxC motif-containing protein